MKIRQGFVSNSSSSSFAIMLTEEDMIESAKDLDPLTLKIVFSLAIDKEIKGSKFKVFTTTVSDEDVFWGLDKKWKEVKDKEKEFGNAWIYEYCLRAELSQLCGNANDKNMDGLAIEF